MYIMFWTHLVVGIFGAYCIAEHAAGLGSYVDLILNPERYTGYSGRSPLRIWRAIYHENCFRYAHVVFGHMSKRCMCNIVGL